MGVKFRLLSWLLAGWFCLWASGCENEKDFRPADKQRSEETGSIRKDQFAGKLAYDVPDSMKVNEASFVQLAVSGGDVDSVTLNVMENPEEAETADIRIRNQMKAELLDRDGTPVNPNFKIVLYGGTPEQAVDLSGKEPTLWEWKVIPLRAGEYKLEVKVSVISIDTLSGKEVQKVVTPSFDQNVTIIAVKEQLSSLWIGAGIMGLTVLGLALYLLMKKQKSAGKDLNSLSARQLIEEGELDLAMEKMRTWVATGSVEANDLHHQLTTLDSRLSQLENKGRRGILRREEEQLERNRITDALTQILSELEQKSR